MVLERLKEWNIPFNVEELIVDFEINVYKSIDEILPNIAILECFSILQKSLKQSGQEENEKHYDFNHEFDQFIKEAIG